MWTLKTYWLSDHLTLHYNNDWIILLPETTEAIENQNFSIEFFEQITKDAEEINPNITNAERYLLAGVLTSDRSLEELLNMDNLLEGFDIPEPKATAIELPRHWRV